MVPEVQLDFTGKVVSVLLPAKDAAWRWCHLDAPRMELQHGRFFLVGKLLHGNRNAVVGIPWDVIQVYYIVTWEQHRKDRQRRHADDAEFRQTRTDIPGVPDER
jgi:hypothetical protein